MAIVIPNHTHVYAAEHTSDIDNKLKFWRDTAHTLLQTLETICSVVESTGEVELINGSKRIRLFKVEKEQ
jgi:hypothetical protein